MAIPKTPPGFTFTRPQFGQNFFKEAYAELKRVNWPTRDQTLRLTAVVILVSVFVGAYIGLLDSLFTKLATFLITS